MRAWLKTCIAAVAVLAVPSFASAQGLYLPGGGGVHGSMGGASSATPLDGIGALYWNPAAMGRLGHSEASIGGNLLFPDIKVSSSFPRPGAGIASGTTRSDSGVGLTSSVGMVYQPDDSRLTFGMGLFTLGGGGVNFPGDPSNPILSPVGPLGRTVIGPIAANLTLIQVAPTVAYKVTDRLVVGAGPTVDITLASFDPAFFGSPNIDPNGGPSSFPTASHSRPFWGGGFRVGLVYSLTDTLDLGFGYTSEQWLETWQFRARDGQGFPRTLNLKASLPAIYSWGIAWRGIDRLTLALDTRYFDYKNTDLFGPRVRDGGLGWDSVFSVAAGAHYRMNDRAAVMAGYQYNTNPLANTSTLFNLQSPAILQHTVSVGTTLALTDSISSSIGYAYSFQNSISGTAQEIPGASIRLSASNHSALFSIGIKFGGGRSRKSPACGPACDGPTYPAAAPTEPTASAQGTVPLQ
jgi:long-chain fatty acid transport protein